MTTYLIASKNTNLLPKVLEARIQNKPLRLKELLGCVPSGVQGWGESISLSRPVDSSCLHSVWLTLHLASAQCLFLPLSHLS